ncbi:MAG: hypothetical protein IJB96_05005 [Lachnospira sp.]|nr:hypothetical protein [Lachnospira sp.]
MRSETRRKLLAVCCVGVSVCIIILAGMLGQKHVDFAEYAVFEYSGINGYAGVQCHIDTEKLYNDLAANESNTNRLNVYRQFVDTLNIMTTQMDLANGDRVYAKVNYNKELAAQAGIRVGSDDVEVRAAGIADGQKVDLFDGVEVVFAGISPDATVVVNNKHKDTYFAGLTFVADKTSGVAVNDKVTVTCQVSEAELGRHGYVAEKLSQEYVADELSTYATDPSQISDDYKMLMQQEIEAGIKRMTEDTTFRMLYKATKDSKYLRMTNKETVSNIQFEMAKFLKKNSTDYDAVDNYIGYLYSADVTLGDDTVKVYFAFEYQQGYITSEGKFGIAHGNLDKRYSCSWDYETILSSTLVGGKMGYIDYDVAKCTTSGE